MPKALSSWKYWSRVPNLASRVATSQLKEPRVMQKLARVTPPPSPRVPQKGLFNGREGQNNWFSGEKSFHHLGLFFDTSDAKVGMSDPTPLTPRATKRPFQLSRRPKRLIFSGKKVFHCEHFFPLRNQWDRMFFYIGQSFLQQAIFFFHRFWKVQSGCRWVWKRCKTLLTVATNDSKIVTSEK